MLNKKAKLIFMLLFTFMIAFNTIHYPFLLKAESKILQEDINQQEDILEPFKISILKNEHFETDFHTILNLAKDNNLPLSIINEQKTIDKLDVIVSKSELLPSINYNFAQSRFQGGFQIFGNNSFKMHRTIIEPQFQLNYTIFSGGETIYKILASKRKLKATEYSFKNNLNDLFLNVSNTYNNLLKANLRLNIAKEQVNQTSEILNLNKQRLENGLGTVLDVSQSQEQYSQSKFAIIQANKDIISTSQQLNELLNLPININLTLSDLSINKKEIIRIENPNVLLDIAYENRPDLLLTKEQKEIYKAQKGMARSQFFPKVTLTSYLGYSGPRLSDLEQQRYIGYSVSMDLLKNLGVNYLANYKKSGPMIKQADLQIQQKIRQIETEVTNSLLEYESSEKNIKVAEDTLKFAEESYKYAVERLKAGVGTNIDVITAQVNLTSNKTNLLESIANFNISQIKLLHNLGLINIETICSEKPLIINENLLLQKNK